MTTWTVGCQPPLSMGFSRQEYWSGLPRPPLGDLPDPGAEPISLTSPVLAGRFFITTAKEKKIWGTRQTCWLHNLRNVLNVMKSYTVQRTLSTPFSTVTQGASYQQPFQLSRPAGAQTPGARPWPGWRPGAPPSGTRPRGPCR